MKKMGQIMGASMAAGKDAWVKWKTDSINEACEEILGTDFDAVMAVSASLDANEPQSHYWAPIPVVVAMLDIADMFEEEAST